MLLKSFPAADPVPVPVQERLMISKIVNYNFKSYAGTQILGPFHKASSLMYQNVCYLVLRLQF